MARHRSSSIIETAPCCQRFTSQGENHSDNEVVLHLEELEAVRLKDDVGMQQIEAAATMGLSRQAFQRILYAARVKIARALVGGRSILIEGGTYVMKTHAHKVDGCCQEYMHTHEVLEGDEIAHSHELEEGGEPHVHNHSHGDCCAEGHTDHK